VVEHLLPGGVQGVLAVRHQPVLRHVDHLPGGRVHGHRSLVAQRRLLGLLLGLRRQNRHGWTETRTLRPVSDLMVV